MPEPDLRAAADVGTTLARARRRLDATSEAAGRDAEILLGHVLGWNRARLVAHHDAILDPAVVSRFQTLMERRRDGEPVAYLTGRREFWSIECLVTPATFIPRHETEHLVEAVLGIVTPTDTANIADIGTGAGPIALALAHERPRARILGADRHPAAVAIARANAERLGADNVSFIVADACTALAPGSWTVIAANPPYIAEDDPHLALGDVRSEPRSALVSGPRGLTMLAALARQAPRCLVRGGWLVLEHGHDQGVEVRALLTSAGFSAVATVPDLAGNERVTLGRHDLAG